MYKPTHGRVLLDGRDLQEWDPEVLRRRIGVIFQDFVRYQLMVGENIGAGDVREFENRERWAEAARQGGRHQVSVHLNRAAAQESASGHARQQQLDAVVHLVEKVRPEGPLRLQAAE